MPTQVATTGQQTQADIIFDAVFERSLDFLVELPFEAIQQFIRRIDQYNDFEWWNVLDALDHVDRLIPRSSYGEGNPNNGKRNYRLKIGREGSPVLYLERIEWMEQPHMTDEQMQLVCREMELIGKADEADFEATPLALSDGRKIKFRFWWD